MESAQLHHCCLIRSPGSCTRTHILCLLPSPTLSYVVCGWVLLGDGKSFLLQVVSSLQHLKLETVNCSPCVLFLFRHTLFFSSLFLLGNHGQSSKKKNLFPCDGQNLFLAFVLQRVDHCMDLSVGCSWTQSSVAV